MALPEQILVILTVVLWALGLLGTVLHWLFSTVFLPTVKLPPPQPRPEKLNPPPVCHQEPPIPRLEEVEVPQDRCFLDEKSLTCEICMEVIYNVLAISNCNHKFCAACILSWADRNNTCPKCRIPIMSMTRDTFVQQIIDQYEEMYPERFQSQEARMAMDKIELEYLMKFLNEERANGTGDNFGQSEENLFDIFEDYQPSRHIRNAYTREEYVNRIERLRVIELAPPAVPAAVAVPSGDDVPAVVGIVNADVEELLFEIAEAIAMLATPPPAPQPPRRPADGPAEFEFVEPINFDPIAVRVASPHPPPPPPRRLAAGPVEFEIVNPEPVIFEEAEVIAMAAIPPPVPRPPPRRPAAGPAAARPVAIRAPEVSERARRVAEARRLPLAPVAAAARRPPAQRGPAAGLPGGRLAAARRLAAGLPAHPRPRVWEGEDEEPRVERLLL